MNPKEKGNKEERKQAKQLSIWMFNDPDVLKRHSSSGADKSVYSGDIVPMKQLDQFGWKNFNFLIEVKSGYAKDKPNFWNYEKISRWYRKAVLEGNQAKQTNIILICQFKNMQALFITNNHFNGKIMFNICIPVHMYNGEIEYAYVYYLKDVLKCKFTELFDEINRQ